MPSEPTFLNRQVELAQLERLWGSERAEFLVLYGRRRIGKTDLLDHFAGERRAMHLEATDVRAEDQLTDFATAYADSLLGLPDLSVDVRSWDQALRMIADAAKTERTLVVFDEFQYLAKQTQGLGSILSRWWRETGRSLNIVLVLAGSDVAFFADEVLGAHAALHGRRTAELQLQPFSPQSARLFFPDWTAEEAIRAYAVWGGVPYYLDFITADRTLEENILDTICSPAAPLQTEAEYLIRMESRLRDVSLYGSVLRAVASGETKVAEIANRLRLDAGNLTRQMERLQAVGLIAKDRPIVQARRTDVAWRISDPFLRFWFRYIAPAGVRLATFDKAARYVAREIMPSLDQFVSMPAFEEICRDHLANLVDAAGVGRWWGPIHEEQRDTGQRRTVEREADGVAIDESGHVVALAACKWTADAVDVSEVNKLRRIGARLEPGRDIPIYLYARNGADEKAAAESAGVFRPIDIIS